MLRCGWHRAQRERETASMHFDLPAVPAGKAAKPPAGRGGTASDRGRYSRGWQARAGDLFGME